MRAPLLAALVALLLLVSVRAAHAGGCPTCTTAADCSTGAFCVVHDSDVGCGPQQSLCCPGQGCDVSTGRPSCEQPGTCAVMCGSAADCTGAGSSCEPSPSSSASWCQLADATCASGRRWGGSAGDGLKGQCLAGAGADAAPGTPDAAPAGTPDAAPGPVTKDSGCGCRVGGRAAAGAADGLPLAALLLVGGLFFALGRRA